MSWNVFKPAPHIPRLPDSEVKRLYPRFRWRIMESTFMGYAAFYLVRNNLSVVAPELMETLNYTKSDIGSLLAITAIAYGLGKFVMGAVSDRSNPRYFMALGLLLTAVCNFAFGWINTFSVHFILWALNGFFQAMGWPPCGRSQGHWFSERERGLMFSIWNTSHNLGGGIAGYVAAWATSYYGGWQYAFYVPGFLALIGSVYILLRLRDTPQSLGLPPIEEYNNDYPQGQEDCEERERELTMNELLFKYVLTNKYVWLLAFANFFTYIARYSMLDWGPMYLREMKGASLHSGGLAVLAIEFGGIPSTILMGWFSDLAGGRRGMLSVLCLIPVIGAFTIMLFTPATLISLDMIMLVIIGLFVYPIINFIVIIALDIIGKKAIGTAAGFIGLFGYLGKTAQAKGFGWILDYATPHWGEQMAWNLVILAIIVCTFCAAILLAFTWNLRPRS